ncbi:MAG TPA: aldo/keto reductase [Planctomycetaceae bacterium]|nr:aldo/keto reductase [Planctomycetaceae bacterium]
MLEKVRLGQTGLMVSRVLMGCIPIQLLPESNAVRLLRYAYDSGVNFYDTAHVYTDSEAKLGAAFSGAQRQNVIIASKTMSDSYGKTIEQIDESQRRLKTDYIDLYQWHNPETNFEDFQHRRGPYQAMQDAQKAGKIRFIGVTQHSVKRARFAVESGAFETLQFPLSLLSSPEEMDVSFLAAKAGMGVIAMKAMCGGLIEDGRLPFAFLNRYPHIVPIWGIKTAGELDQFLELSKHPEPFTNEMQAEVEKLRAEYGDEFCRCCGYCLPCPVGIAIPQATRVTTMVKRGAMLDALFTPEHREKMRKIDDCTNCRTCVSCCPYHLDVPRLLKEQQEAYVKMNAERQDR